jgi:glycosyltransferase involved in cell wall biosynthesis
MPVYNDAPYIAEAMESILAQDGPDLEFVIVDDAGTDGSSAILRSFSDNRITLICQNVNRGLAASLNDGLRYCRGKYIARQDGDDVSEPGRFRKQVAYLDRNAGIAYVGTGVVVIDEKGKLGKTHLYPESPNEIRECFKRWKNPLPHSTLMFRREALASVNGYDELIMKGEDYDLHLRMLARFDAASMQEALVRLRMREYSLQFEDRSGGFLKYMIFARARQLAEERYGSLSRMEQLSLLSGLDQWFQESKLGGRWRAGFWAHQGAFHLRQGRLWRGVEEISKSIAEDPQSLLNRLLHRERRVITQREEERIEGLVRKAVCSFESINSRSE